MPVDLSRPLLPAGPHSAPPIRFVATSSVGQVRLNWSITRLSQILLYEDMLSRRITMTDKSAVRSQSQQVPLSGPGWQHVAVTITSTVIGAGVLGLPFALSHAGWFGLVIIAGSTVVASFTAKMLVWSFNKVNEEKTARLEAGDLDAVGKGFVGNYDQLAEELAGVLGGVVMRVLTLIETFGVAVCFVVFHSASWPGVLHLPERVLGTESRVVACICMCTAAFPLLLLRVRHLSRFSPVGLVATATLCIASICAPISAWIAGELSDVCVPLDGSVLDDTRAHHTFVPGGLGIATSLILFSFGGHAVFPEVFQSMPASERPNFDTAVTLGFSAAGCFFVLIAAVGYSFYGSCVADTVTLNLMHSSTVFGTLATLATLASTFFSFPVFCVPTVRIVASAVEKALEPKPVSVEGSWQADLKHQISQVRSTVTETKAKVEATAAVLLLLSEKVGVKVPEDMASILVGENRPNVPPPADDRDCISGRESPTLPPDEDSPWEPMTRVGFGARVGVVASAALLAAIVPNFGFVVSLLGAFSTMLLCFIMPAAFYLQLHHTELRRMQLLLCMSIIVVGFIGMVVGLHNTLATLN